MCSAEVLGRRGSGSSGQAKKANQALVSKRILASERESGHTHKKARRDEVVLVISAEEDAADRPAEREESLHSNSFLVVDVKVRRAVAAGKGAGVAALADVGRRRARAEGGRRRGSIA